MKHWILPGGIDERPVRANRIRKSVGAENTFASDLKEFDPMAAELQPLIDKVWQHCESTGNRGRTVTLVEYRFRPRLLNRDRICYYAMESVNVRFQSGSAVPSDTCLLLRC